MNVPIFLAATLGSGAEIPLPAPSARGGMSVEEAIAQRRSVRSFTSQELSLTEISQLLWSLQGITDTVRGFRAAPSAGALYPLEVYLLDRGGVYHYIPSEHKLVKKIDRDLRKELAVAALSQPWVEHAPAVFVIAAVYSRVSRKYGEERGARYVHIEVGHAAENLHLQAVALGLGSVPVGAFYDREVKKLLSLPPDEEPLYIIPVGHPR